MCDGGSLAGETAERLRDLMLHQTHFLIVQRVNSPYYVQFLATPGGELRCEAVSNEYLDPPFCLDEEAELDLIGLGWASADPNFRQLWDEPIPFAEIGERMARTLINVFGARGVEDVTFTWDERADGH